MIIQATNIDILVTRLALIFDPNFEKSNLIILSL